MEMHSPKHSSSHIEAIGYDEETGTLAVTFNKGGTYHYAGVDADTYVGLSTAASPGEYFHANVKGRFRHQRG